MKRWVFFQGDLEQKITPHLRPLYDALREMLEPEEMERAIARQTIEVAPAGVHARPHVE
mgnify:CR=1 FL=1